MVSEQGIEQGWLPWAGAETGRNGMPVGKPYVWRRTERRARPVVKCPDHPYEVLCPVAGGAGRGTSPVDGRSYQMDRAEGKAVMGS
jgi:hypothetical protein